MFIVNFLFGKSDKNVKKKDRLMKDYICKYVKQDTTSIGESIAVTEERIIVKSEDAILSIPMSAVIKLVGDDVISIGDFNRKEVEEAGETWVKETKKELKFDEKGMLL